MNKQLQILEERSTRKESAKYVEKKESIMQLLKAYGPKGTQAYFDAHDMILNDRDELMKVYEFPDCMTSSDFSG